MSEFLAMGGYAVYVWPSYGITLVFLVSMAALPWYRYRRLRRRLAAGARR